MHLVGFYLSTFGLVLEVLNSFGFIAAKAPGDSRVCHRSVVVVIIVNGFTSKYILEQFQSRKNISTYSFDSGLFLDGNSAGIFTTCFNEVTEEAPRTCFTFNLFFVFSRLMPLRGGFFGLGPGRLREKTVLNVG